MKKLLLEDYKFDATEYVILPKLYIGRLRTMNELEEALKVKPKTKIKPQPKPVFDRGVRMNKPQNARPRGRG